MLKKPSDVVNQVRNLSGLLIGDRLETDKGSDSCARPWGMAATALSPIVLTKADGSTGLDHPH